MGRLRTIVVTGIFLVIAFAAGYVPQEIEKRRLAATLEKTELDLRLANLHRQLGVASHEAQRNNFATAAEAARQFFDGCRALATEHDFEGQPRTHGALQAYAQSADVILGQLATADPAAKERLAGLYLTMNGLLERRQ
jgi:hypothetical protein